MVAVAPPSAGGSVPRGSSTTAAERGSKPGATSIRSASLASLTATTLATVRQAMAQAPHHQRVRLAKLVMMEEVVCQRLCAQWEVAYARVDGILGRVVRASSAVEGLNSVLRMHQARHREHEAQDVLGARVGIADGSFHPRHTGGAGIAAGWDRRKGNLAAGSWAISRRGCTTPPIGGTTTTGKAS